MFAVVGVVALFLAARRDRRSAARVRAAMKSVPDREIPRFDPETPAPEYLAELEARERPPAAPSTDLGAAERSELRRLIASDRAVRLDGGYPDRDFATDAETGWAVLPDALILYTADEVAAMRELLPVLDQMPASQSLVVVAPRFGDEVIGTLRVNMIQRKLRAVPVLSAADLTTTIAATGGEMVTSQDLKAGYLPRTALGEARWWISDPDTSWIIADR